MKIFTATQGIQSESRKKNPVPTRKNQKEADPPCSCMVNTTQ
jgi:hypothetical protein